MARVPRRTSIIKEDGGFSFVEILVAFSVLAFVLLGAIPLLWSGLRSTLITRTDTTAKNLAQERVEQMRNYLYHIDVNAPPAKPSVCWTDVNKTDPEAGAEDCDYRDLLDTYFRSLTAATSAATGGYVSPTSTFRGPDEPAGAFYRFVVDPVPGFSDYRQVIASQFLNSLRQPVTPPDTYNSQIAGQDFPASRLLGVTVVTTWQVGALSKKYVLFTQIAADKPAVPAVTLQARATGLRVSGGLRPPFVGDPNRLLALEAGISSSDGSLATGATASTNVQGSFLSIAPGVRVDSRSAGASAPPDQAASDAGDGDPDFSLIDGGGESSPSCVTSSCVGYSQAGIVRNVNASILSGQPLVASSASPATGRVRASGGSLNVGYRNKPDAGAMPGLDISRMLVRIDAPGGTTPTVVGTTYLKSVEGGAHEAEAGATSNTHDSEWIKIVPTTFEEDGIVQVRLISASLVCKTNGTTGSAIANFEARVRYLMYDPTDDDGENEYVEVVVKSGQALSPLTDALLTTTQINTNPGGVPALVPLSSYIDSWESLTQATTTITSPPKSVTSSLNGIVSVTTQPTRVGDAESAVAVQVGVLSCVAEDNR
jgi:type II secretory pathway pseudopilin PulG